MVKNYLVSAVRPIRDGWHLEKNQDLYLNYQIMSELSLASYQKFLTEPFEFVLLTDPVDNNYQNNLSTWNYIYELWHREPCNILWAGADTFMVQPTKIFQDVYQDYRLFNYTDPRTVPGFPHYFNDDVQLFPHTMKPETWQVGLEFWNKGHDDPAVLEWGFDQMRHNAMFWSQDIAITDRLHPWFNYMCHDLRELSPPAVQWVEQWNQFALDRAHILHFAASRGSQAVIDIMRQLCDKLGIQYATHT